MRRQPNVLCALQILIAPEYRGQALSSRMIQRMAEIGRAHGLDTLIAPVRPNLKHSYPLTPIERYIEWRRPDGMLLDPWLRTHERLGAEIAKVALESMRIPGTVAQWEEWTELAFPESGRVRRARRARAGRDRPRAGRGALRRAQRLDGRTRLARERDEPAANLNEPVGLQRVDRLPVEQVAPARSFRHEAERPSPSLAERAFEAALLPERLVALTA